MQDDEAICRLLEEADVLLGTLGYRGNLFVIVLSVRSGLDAGCRNHAAEQELREHLAVLGTMAE